MKKIFTLILATASTGALFAQPVIRQDSLHTGLTFDVYGLSGVSSSNVSATGANASWDVSAGTATLLGVVEFLEMSATPYATQYPSANFAMKFTLPSVTRYTLFTVTSTVMEEVALSVGTPNETALTNPRTTLIFPYTFNASNTDTYQKASQSSKSITSTYDSYGTLVTGLGTYTNVSRILGVDDGSTSAMFWNNSPVHPLLQVSGTNYTLWKLTGSTVGISKVEQNAAFHIYPNPATQRLSTVNSEIITQIEILNSAGQLQFTTTSADIDISNLPAGMYFIKAYSAQGSTTKKFVKL